MNRTQCPPILLLLILIIGAGGCSNGGSPLPVLELTESSSAVPEVGEPILEIWKEREGSVPIRGMYLYLRLDASGTYEFDYLTRKVIDSPPKRIDFSLHRSVPARVSGEKLREIEQLLLSLAEDKNVKNEYPIVGLTLDAFDKLTIELTKKDSAVRTIALNNSEYDVMDSSFAKDFPASVSNLIKTIHSLRYESVCDQYPSSDLKTGC